MRVVVMAKSPRPGYAKTRLATAIGDDAAARLAARMLDHALMEAVEAAVGPVELCAAPDASDARLLAAAARAGTSIAAQGDGDLGARLARAAVRAFADAPDGVLILGTDAPDLGAAEIRAAAQALRSGHDAAIVPAHDGGYALIALARPLPAFDGIAWSTSAVMQQTLRALRRCGARVAVLAPVHDIDEARDLAHLPKEWRGEIDSPGP